MPNEAIAQTSNTLFHVAFVVYILAMVLSFFRLAFTRVSVAGVPTSTSAGRLIGWVATGLTLGAAIVHGASVVTRGMAAGGRVPWANMYEYSSLVALIAIVVGLLVVQRRMGYGHLMGFVLAGAVLLMTSALLLYDNAAPVQPALNSYWIKIHTSAAMGASSIFMVAFAATALYLIKDAAERRVAVTATYDRSTVGAAQLSDTAVLDGYEVDVESDDAAAPASAPAQRDALSPVLFPVVPFVVVGLFTLLVWRAPTAALIAGSVAALLGTASWYSVPVLPPAARLDTLAYRVIAFGFPIWTFAVMAGAIWAEEAWGRYWGWDPKETGSFVTWVLYASYLHARSTRGWRGRRAAWIGVVAFGALMVTYYAVNLWIVGLHSYARA